MKINPIFMKDLRLNVRSMKFATIIFAYTFCLGLLAVMFLYAGMCKQDGQMVFNYENCNEFVSLISGVELAVILFVVPILTAGTIANERERQTLDYLLISKLRPFDIICGKMAYALTAALVFILSSFPVNTIIVSTGAIPIKVHFQLLLLFLVTAIFSASIGMFFSVLKKRTIPALALTYIVLVVITFGTIVTYKLNHYILEDMRIATLGDGQTLPWMFLLNPVATYCYIVVEYSNGMALTWFAETNQANWVECSIFFQLAISIFLIWVSAMWLKPPKKRIKIEFNCLKRNKKKKRKTL